MAKGRAPSFSFSPFSAAEATPQRFVLKNKRGGSASGGLRRHKQANHKCKKLQNLYGTVNSNNHCEEEPEAGGENRFLPQIEALPERPPSTAEARGKAAH